MLVYIAQLLKADIMLAKHIKQHDAQRVYVRFETIRALFSANCILLRRSEPQRSHSRCLIAKHYTVLIDLCLHLRRVLLDLQRLK